jgi:hypothetical protein
MGSFVKAATLHTEVFDPKVVNQEEDDVGLAHFVFSTEIHRKKNQPQAENADVSLDQGAEGGFHAVGGLANGLDEGIGTF